MKLHQFFTAAAVGLATVGQLIPAPMLHAGEPIAAKSPTKPAKAVLDVALTEDGALQGEVFNAKRVPVKDAVISIRQGNNEVAKSRTNADGGFSVPDLKPGVYYVVAGTGHGIYRVWAADKASNKMLSKIKVVSDRGVVRAQSPDGQGSSQQVPGPDGRILYDNNGVAYGQVRIVDQGGLVPVGAGAPVGVAGGGTFLSSLGVYDVALLGLSAGAIVVGAVALDRANDAEDAANAAANSP